MGVTRCEQRIQQGGAVIREPFTTFSSTSSGGARGGAGRTVEKDLASCTRKIGNKTGCMGRQERTAEGRTLRRDVLIAETPAPRRCSAIKPASRLREFTCTRADTALTSALGVSVYSNFINLMRKKKHWFLGTGTVSYTLLGSSRTLGFFVGPLGFVTKYS